MRVGLKIGYDGRRFHGFARQPDVRTVEGEVISALRKAGLITGSESARLRGASRTDAGVSALGNVVAFDADVEGETVVGRFNDAAKDVWAWAFAILPSGFDPRRARLRWYRYHLAPEHDVEAIRAAVAPFVGSHNFAAFAHPDAPHTEGRLDSADVTGTEDGVLIDLRARGFLRGMVRRIVAAALAVEAGEVRIETLAASLIEGRGKDLGVASAEPLVLMDVDEGIPFRPSVDRATRERIARRFSHERLLVRFWREAAERVGPEPRELGTLGRHVPPLAAGRDSSRGRAPPVNY